MKNDLEQDGSMMATETVGDRVRRIRKDRGLSQAEVARRAGMNAASLNRIEKGSVKDPQPRTIRDLAQALNVSENDLRGM